MSVTIIGRRGSREVKLVRQDEDEITKICASLRSLGYDVIQKPSTLSDTEFKDLRKKIDSICLKYVLDIGGSNAAGR